MKITQDVRDYAAKLGIDKLEVALETGMRGKAEEFKDSGGKVYQDV
jgi:phosphomethylpyrimidine synthase